MNALKLIEGLTDADIEQMAESRPCPFRHPERVCYLGHGFAVTGSATCLRSGLGFYQLEVNAKSDTSCAIPLEAGYWYIACVIDGDLTISLPGEAERKLGANAWSIFRASSLNLTTHGKGPLRLFFFICESEVFQSIFEPDRKAGNPIITNVATADADQDIMIHGEAAGRLSTLSRWIKLPEKRISDRLMLEARCLEWLSELSHSPVEAKQRSVYCTSHDEGRIRAVADYLEANLDTDLTLSELSLRFGINEFKLKQGFRQIYQLPVFRYLKNKRIERAESRLRESDESVISIANEVGYANPGHFAAAFKERYGLLPKAYQCVHRQRR